MNKRSKIEYEQRIVAFIDILGFKEIIKTSEKDKTKLKNIYETLQFLKSKESPGEWGLKYVEIEEDAQKKGVENFDISSSITCTCFSDTILVSVKCNDANINEIISTLVTMISYIGASLMANGILIRGGITVGNIIHMDSGIVMGPALIEAYELEASTAVNPRIILSKKLLSKLNYPIYTKKNRYPYHQYFQRFEDGCVGFHQMIHFEVMEAWPEIQQTLKTELKKAKSTIINGLDATFESPNIHAKFQWLKRMYDDLFIDSKLKEKIYNLNEGIAGQNVHYSYVDEFYYPSKSKKPQTS